MSKVVFCCLWIWLYKSKKKVISYFKMHSFLLKLYIKRQFCELTSHSQTKLDLCFCIRSVKTLLYSLREWTTSVWECILHCVSTPYCNYITETARIPVALCWLSLCTPNNVNCKWVELELIPFKQQLLLLKPLQLTTPVDVEWMVFMTTEATEAGGIFCA